LAEEKLGKGLKLTDRAVALMKENFVCDNCLGRSSAELLSGLTNKERGKIIRNFIAMLVDSGEKFDVRSSNFYGIKFRNSKIKPEKPEKCGICKNFFLGKADELAKTIVKKTNDYDFDTFLIGTIVSDDLAKMEEETWQKIGVEFVEPIKNEINREVGKSIEKLTKNEKRFSLKEPDITAIIDLGKNKVALQVRSLYIYGKYKKFVRGIPQTKWVCRECGGKGCVRCKGEGKMYKTSVQEVIEKPLLKAAQAKKSKFHGAGREDIDARCLACRPFVMELLRPMKRTLDLKKMQAQINRSKKVNVTGLNAATKKDMYEIKSSKYDKTYFAEVTFEKKIDKKKLRLLKTLKGETIQQKTPSRVVHRRANLLRRRKVKEISVKVIGKKKLVLKIKGEAGLYIKELISGDSGRTEPNIAGILDNKVKNIKLDVIRIHTS